MVASEDDVVVVVHARGIPLSGVKVLADALEEVWPGTWVVTDSRKVGEFRFIRKDKARA